MSRPVAARRGACERPFIFFSSVSEVYGVRLFISYETSNLQHTGASKASVINIVPLLFIVTIDCTVRN